MSLSNPPDYEFIAYIDEAGDAAINRVRPLDEKGGTEWMVLSAMLVRRKNEEKLMSWVQDIGREFGEPNTRVIKFAKRSHNEKLIACNHISNLPLRIFSVASNKRNMRGYRNKRAERAGGKQWFYNWMVRILLARITHYCYHKADRAGIDRNHLKIVFSKTGNHLYSQTAAYHEILKFQSPPLILLSA